MNTNNQPDQSQSVSSLNMSEPKSKIVILGAGPAGLSAAKYLSGHGQVEVTVLEQDHQIGGLMRSYNFDGNEYDVGTILFSHNHGLIDAFPYIRDSLVKIKYKPRSINPKNKLDVYPFSISGYTDSYGYTGLVRSVLEVCISKLKYRKKNGVAQFAKYYMGSSFYKQSGLQNYIYRLHEINDNELDVEFAIRRLAMIKRQSFRAIATRVFGFGKNNKKIGGSMMVRPVEGFQWMFGKISDDLIESKVQIRTGVNVSNISKNKDGFSLRVDGQDIVADEVISTIPIDSCLKMFGYEGNDTPRTKGLISLFFRGHVLPRGNTFFNFSYSGRWKRMTVFSRFYDALPNEDGKDWFTVEITSDDQSEEAVQALVQEYKKLSQEFKLLDKEPEFVGSIFNDNAYPMYTPETVKQVNDELEQLKELGVHALGRQGNFEYVISNIVARRAKAISSKLVDELDVNNQSAKPSADGEK